MPAYARVFATTLLAPPLVVGLFAATGCGSSGQEVVVAPVVTGKEPGTTGQEPTGGGGYESPGSAGGYEPPGSGGAYEPPTGGSTGSGSGSATDGGLSIGSSSGGTTIGSSSGSTNTDCPPCAATYSCVVTPSATTGPLTVVGAVQADGSCILASTAGVVVLACGGTVLGATDGGTGTIGVWAANGSGGFTASGDGDVFTCQ